MTMLPLSDAKVRKYHQIMGFAVKTNYEKLKKRLVTVLFSFASQYKQVFQISTIKIVCNGCINKLVD